MSKKPDRLEAFIEMNLPKVLAKETQDSLGDRSKYIGSSDIGGCPYKIVMDKKNPPTHSLKQQIIFQRGHLAENLVKKMLDGLDAEEQYEVFGEIDGFKLKSHIDFLLKAKKRNVIVEAKTVSAPTDIPYESWVLQVQYQMGLLQQECEEKVEAHVLAIDLNSGWFKTFYFEQDDALFELALNKAQHIIDALKGLVEPQAIIQNYCSSCHLKMTCPKQGKFAEDLPEDIKMDLEFIKVSKKMAKESKLREERVKSYLVNTGVKIGKDSLNNSIVSVREQEKKKFDRISFDRDYPGLYEKYTNASSNFTMTVL